MEQINETIDLDIEESNDLTFKIRLEGNASAPARVRLVCEGKDMSYMFNGYGTGEDEVVQFTLPKMDSRLVEGLYASRVEVMIDNKYFVPLQFYLNFKKSINVVAESIQVAPKTARQELKVSATPVVAKPASQPSQASIVKFEQKPNVKTQVPAQRNESAGPAPTRTLKDVFENKVKSQKPADSLDEGTLRQITRALIRDKAKK